MVEHYVSALGPYDIVIFTLRGDIDYFCDWVVQQKKEEKKKAKVKVGKSN
jgi:hypothetical protein